MVCGGSPSRSGTRWVVDAPMPLIKMGNSNVTSRFSEVEMEMGSTANCTKPLMNCGRRESSEIIFLKSDVCDSGKEAICVVPNKFVDCNCSKSPVPIV